MKVPVSLVSLALLVVFGIVINHDLPNLFEIIAILLLCAALFIRPHQHTDNKRPLLKYSVLIIGMIILISNIVQSLNAAQYRDLLQQLAPAFWFGVALYIVTAILTLNIIYLFKKSTPEEKSIIANNKWLALSVPLLWFMASLPEGFAKSQIPIYTFISLGSISFLMCVASDLHNRRIILNLQTTVFGLIVLASIVFSALSIHH